MLQYSRSGVQYFYVLVLTLSCIFLVDVVASPAIVQNPQNATILATEDTTFSCEFSGDPTPDVQWTFIPPSPLTPVVITSVGVYTINNQISDNSVISTLMISPATHANTGAYMCTANNGAPTTATGTATLQIIGRFIINV